MTAVDTSQDIDSLLAQADSLMNEMAGNLGVSTTTAPQAAAAPPPPDIPTGQADEAAISQIVDGLAAVVEAADHDAIVERLDAERPDSAEPAQVEHPIESEGTIQTIEGEGPKPAPEDWVAEADLTEDTGVNVPSIPEAANADASTSSGVVEQAQIPTSPRGFAGWVRAGFRAPVDLLILLDRPFARLSMPVKACIGYAAIATLLMAAGTTVLGSILRPN